MERNRNGAFASILICVTVLMFVTLLGHPAAGGRHGRGGDDMLALLYAARFHLGVMHGAAMVLQVATLTCILAFCAQLGFTRPFPAFAAVAFCAATAGIGVAVSLDGFLIPAFAGPHLSFGDGTAIDMRSAIAAGAIVIQYATKLSIALMAVSMLLLSLDLLASRTMRAVAVSGVALAVIQAAALITFVVLTPHNVAFSALPVLIWQLALGIAWRAYRVTPG